MHSRRTITPALVLALALGLGGALTGCTTTERDPGPTTPTLSVAEQAAAEAEEAAAAHFGECVDGFAQLQAEGTPLELGDCETVSILGSDTEITLGHVGTLTVEGDGDTITAGSVDRVLYSGSRNAVTTEGTAPTVDDLSDSPESNTTTLR